MMNLPLLDDLVLIFFYLLLFSVLPQSWCFSEDIFHIWNFDTQSELCGGQILKPRDLPVFSFDEKHKIFKFSGSRVIDDKIEVGGVDTCQVGRWKQWRAISDLK